MVDGLGQLKKKFKTQLDAQDDIQIVRIADTAVGAIEQQEDVNPDVILMDFLVVGGTGVATARVVRGRYPDAALVLLYGERPEDRSVAEFGGVTVTLPITSGASAVVDIVREVAQRRKGPSPDLDDRGGDLTARSAREPDRAPAQRLSGRERQLLQLISLGLTSREIANELGLSISTARTYTQRLLEKLDSHSKAEAVLKAIQRGLMEP